MQDGQDDEPPKLCSDEPGLAACYAAAARGVAASGDRAGQAPLRLLVSPAPAVSEIYDENDPVAEVRGVNLHARQCVDGRDRRQLEPEWTSAARCTSQRRTTVGEPLRAEAPKALVSAASGISRAPACPGPPRAPPRG